MRNNGYNLFAALAVMLCIAVFVIGETWIKTESEDGSVITFTKVMNEEPPASQPSEPEFRVLEIDLVNEGVGWKDISFVYDGKPDIVKMELSAVPTKGGGRFTPWTKTVEPALAGVVRISVSDLQEAWPEATADWEVTVSMTAFGVGERVVTGPLALTSFRKVAAPPPATAPSSSHWPDVRLGVPQPPANALRPTTAEQAIAMVKQGLRPLYIEGLEFTLSKGEQLNLEGARDVWVFGNTFIVDKGGWHTGHSIRILYSDEIYVGNNTFIGVPGKDRGGAAIGGGYKNQDIWIVNNTFIDCHEPIHLVDAHATEGRLRIAKNYYKNTERMGVEIQGEGALVHVQGDWYEYPRMEWNAAKNRWEPSQTDPTIFSHSIATPETTKVVFIENTTIGDARASADSDSTRLGMAHEMAGRDIVYDRNRIYDWAGCAGISLLSKHGAPYESAIKVTNSLIHGVPEKPGIGWGGPIMRDPPKRGVLNIGENVSIFTGERQLPAKPDDVGAGGFIWR